MLIFFQTGLAIFVERIQLVIPRTVFDEQFAFVRDDGTIEVVSFSS